MNRVDAWAKKIPDLEFRIQDLCLETARFLVIARSANVSMARKVQKKLKISGFS